MNKKEFFNQFQSTLASKYGIPLKHIETIRSAVLGRKITRKELAEIVAIKLSQSSRSGRHKPNIGRRSHSKAYYQTLLNFIASCSEEAWKDIVQKTEYDK